MKFWSVAYRVLLVTAIVAVIFGLVTIFTPAVRRYRNYRAERDRLESAIREEEELYPILMRRIDALQNDPAEVERVAREKLGLARPGETIFRFRTPPDGTVYDTP